MGNFPNLSFHCLVMPTAVFWFWGNSQLEETRLHISSSGVWMMAFSMVLWSQFYTWVMAALNYSHNIMGKRINPSLPSFICKAVGKWGEATYPKGINWWWGYVRVRKGSLQQALLKCSQMLTHYLTNLSSPDARGKTKWERMNEESENRANPFTSCSFHSGHG